MSNHHPIDPIADGLSRGWSVFGHAGRPAPTVLECDVAIVGSGAGAGVTAELLTAAGLKIVIIEEGPLRSSRDFRQLESDAYPSLYQESAARKTHDQAITILQGRCVGGSTTVNWTSSFRTPPSTLKYWRERLGLVEMADEALARWFLQAERRFNIAPWLAAPNANNEVLQRGATRLGIATASIQRNVRGCWNLGSCGLGCPTNAKQSMLVTTLPVALDRGATLLVATRVERMDLQRNKVVGLQCVPVELNAAPAAGGQSTRVTARHYVVAGGAINSPALLLRSAAPDPHGLLGARTFLHPVVASRGVFRERIEGWQGAPQSVYSDHYLEAQAIDGPIGYKLEVAPLHPLLYSTTINGFGRAAAARLAEFPHSQATLALMRDGFHPQSPGGQVKLRSDGSPVLHYPINAYLMDGARRAFLSMAEIQFAAGAEQVVVGHEFAPAYANWGAAQAGIRELAMQPLSTRLFSAHVMGGCPMAADERNGVVQANGRHWQLNNLSVHDGSLFPTSIGANPQLSIYGLVNKLASQLAFELSGRTVQLAG